MLALVVGAFAEMSEDVSRICGITAHDLARTHVSYYNGDAKRTKGMNSNSNQYSPIWHRSQCCGVKWGARVLRVRSVSREEEYLAACHLGDKSCVSINTRHSTLLALDLDNCRCTRSSGGLPG